jgi:gamma-glutamylcyclotransferase (GGCT)/AIG2-like uncharacterized protein YtfP
MRLFLYGTLLDPDLLTAFTGRAVSLTPATLRGWRRVALPNSRYPTLRRARGVVQGALVTVDRSALARLAAYEGPSYRLTPVVVHRPHGATRAWAWIAPCGTRRDWLQRPDGRPPHRRVEIRTANRPDVRRGQIPFSIAIGNSLRSAP